MKAEICFVVFSRNSRLDPIPIFCSLASHHCEAMQKQSIAFEQHESVSISGRMYPIKRPRYILIYKIPITQQYTTTVYRGKDVYFLIFAHIRHQPRETFQEFFQLLCFKLKTNFDMLARGNSNGIPRGESFFLYIFCFPVNQKKLTYYNLAIKTEVGLHESSSASIVVFAWSS